MPDGAIILDIWMVEPQAGTEGLLPAMLARLEPEARDRVTRLVRQGDRTLHALAHALLRHALRQHGVHEMRFATAPYGKPTLADASCGIGFNLTHTDGLAACAIVHGHEVGIDAEALDRRVEPGVLAPSVLTEPEAASLRASPRPEARFLELWTLKEAVAKAAGLGLRLPLKAVEVLAGPPGLRFAPELGWDEAEWHVEMHRPTERHGLAVALRRPQGRAVLTRLHVMMPRDLV